MYIVPLTLPLVKHYLKKKLAKQKICFFGNSLATNERQIKMLIRIDSAHFVPLIYKM